MTVDYAAAKLDALAGIAEGGTAATLIRRGAATGSAHNPVAGADTEYACTVLLLSYTQRERDGTLVQAEDRKAMIAAEGLAIVPDTRDKLRVGAATFDIVQVMPFDPGGVVVFYDAQIRR